MFAGDAFLNGAQDLLHFPPSSLRDVNYSCGSCGYELNLNSCNRNTSVIGRKYEKSIKRGLISFFSIDESRFTQIDVLQWMPRFKSKHSWGLFRRRTKLLCRKCGNYIGIAYKDESNSYSLGLDEPNKIGWDGISDGRTYDIKIRALQPSFFEKSGVLI